MPGPGVAPPGQVAPPRFRCDRVGADLDIERREVRHVARQAASVCLLLDLCGIALALGAPEHVRSVTLVWISVPATACWAALLATVAAERLRRRALLLVFVGPGASFCALGIWALGGWSSPVMLGCVWAALNLAPICTRREYVAVAAAYSAAAGAGFLSSGGHQLPLHLTYWAFLTCLIAVAGDGVSRLAHQRRADAQRLREVAELDPLTGLLNRRAFTTRASAELCRLGAADAGAVVLFFDGDRFKAINDTHGHDAGDRALRAAARELQDRYPGALVGRWGGDEFVVLVPGDPAADLSQPHERLLVQDGDLRLSLTVGQAGFPTDATDLDALITIADSHLIDDKAARPAEARVPARRQPRGDTSTALRSASTPAGAQH